jgi:hypothetical protein
MSDNPAKLYEWYERHRGIKVDRNTARCSSGQQKDGKPGGTAWSIFSRDAK